MSTFADKLKELMSRVGTGGYEEPHNKAFITFLVNHAAEIEALALAADAAVKTFKVIPTTEHAEAIEDVIDALIALDKEES